MIEKLLVSVESRVVVELESCCMDLVAGASCVSPLMRKSIANENGSTLLIIDGQSQRIMRLLSQGS